MMTTHTGGGQPAANGIARDSLIDLQTFPILTEEVDSGPATIPGSGSRRGADSTVSQALRGILGWRPRRDDPKGFVAALKQSFVATEREGRTEWLWSPHSYTIAADVGAVTGAQASLYQRAQVALRESMPILERLFPLRSDADDDDIEASRAIVESDLRELVGELGYVGGPRVQRVERLFTSLLGHDFQFTNPEDVQGGLGKLRDELGLERKKVNTIEEEQNLTDFFVMVDYVSSLKATFEAQGNFFNRRGSDVFLGTQLVLLGRALSALAESVHQSYYVLDSVFIGEAERETISLELDPDQPPITIAELLSWVEHVATEEGPRLIREGGKEGVISLAPTLRQLAELLRKAKKIADKKAHNPLRGFHTQRVRNVFQELTAHAVQSAELAEQIKREDQATPDVLIESADLALVQRGNQTILRVLVRVRNDGDEPAPTQGPDPGFLYQEGESFLDIGEAEIEGAIRVGVDYAARAADEIDHPYRWGLGRPLAPGERRLIDGEILLDPSIRGDQEFWVGLVCELREWIETGEEEKTRIAVARGESVDARAVADATTPGESAAHHTGSPHATDVAISTVEDEDEQDDTDL